MYFRAGRAISVSYTHLAIAHSEKELDEILAGKNTDDVFIIGGGKVYREFLNRCDTCYVTKIFDKFLADTWFVNLDEMKDFSIVWQSEVQEEKGIRYQFLEYRRI